MVLQKSSLYFSFSIYRYINSCDRLVYTGRNMLLNQVLFLSLLKNIMFCLFPLICSLITCHPSPPFLWEVHCYSVQMMSSKKEAPLSHFLSPSPYCAHSIALSLDLKPCRTSRLLVVNNNNNNKDSEQQKQHQRLTQFTLNDLQTLCTLWRKLKEKSIPEDLVQIQQFSNTMEVNWT